MKEVGVKTSTQSLNTPNLYTPLGLRVGPDPDQDLLLQESSHQF